MHLLILHIYLYTIYREKGTIDDEHVKGKGYHRANGVNTKKSLGKTYLCRLLRYHLQHHLLKQLNSTHVIFYRNHFVSNVHTLLHVELDSASHGACSSKDAERLPPTVPTYDAAYSISIRFQRTSCARPNI